MSAVPQDEFAEAEAILRQWGDWARRMSDGLGYPRSSGIHCMIETVKVFERRPEHSPLTQVTACGRQKPVMRPREVELPPEGVMRIDAEIARLPGWMQSPIHRAYLWGQPDRIAARELRISRQLFTSRREAAVRYVKGRLDD